MYNSGCGYSEHDIITLLRFNLTLIIWTNHGVPRWHKCSQGYFCIVELVYWETAKYTFRKQEAAMCAKTTHTPFLKSLNQYMLLLIGFLVAWYGQSSPVR